MSSHINPCLRGATVRAAWNYLGTVLSGWWNTVGGSQDHIPNPGEVGREVLGCSQVTAQRPQSKLDALEQNVTAHSTHSLLTFRAIMSPEGLCCTLVTTPPLPAPSSEILSKSSSFSSPTLAFCVRKASRRFFCCSSSSNSSSFF